MNHAYRRTLYASYIGYVTQAIVNNLAPLLFVIFQDEFSLSVSRIGFLITYNFSVQILVDFLAARYVQRIGYKPAVVAAHVLSAAGIVGMSIFPSLLPAPYIGLLLAVTVYAIGGGLLEVLISPIVQALPMDQKSASMSLLHAFYCWGHVGVVVLSTVFFRFVGTEHWRALPLLWALIPVGNVFLFLSAPIRTMEDDGASMPMKQLVSLKLFWLFVLLMICSGASEQAMSQWSSYFSEKGLQVSKTVGDLLGPCMFALLMGASRWFYGTKSEKIPLRRFIVGSSILCVFSYLLAVFSPFPILSLVGCGLCGLSVGIMWPGVFSLAAEHCPQGGTAMFALLALAGDLGCAGGPALVGTVAEWAGDSLKAGLLLAVIFPLALALGVRKLSRRPS